MTGTDYARGGLLGVAGDGGALEAVRALADGERCVVVEPSLAEAADAGYWDSLLGDPRYVGLVVGTSDSPAGKETEALARRAAANRDKPVFAIEDYPGNYWPMDDAPTHCLTIESDLVAEWQRLRLGPNCPSLMVWPATRYDRLRERREVLRQSIRHASGLSAAGVLWAGQPETDDNLASLAALVPALKACDARLLFRAHPRDPGYPGRYGFLRGHSGLEIEDVSREPLDHVLPLGPRVIATQFSAVAVEAGFYGIPALHVLLPEAGGARLMQKKGYSKPFAVRVGAAAMVSKPSDVERVLGDLLYDNRRRNHIMLRFDTYFCGHPGNAPELGRRWLTQALARSGVPGGHA